VPHPQLDIICSMSQRITASKPHCLSSVASTLFSRKSIILAETSQFASPQRRPAGGTLAIMLKTNLMKNIFLIIFLTLITSAFAQESQIDTVAKAKYERLKVGDSLKIYMQVRGTKVGTLGAGDFDKNRKFNAKTDFLFSGIITDKFVIDGPNWYIKIKIEKMFLRGRKVKKMIILGEEMFIGTEAAFSLSKLEVE